MNLDRRRVPVKSSDRRPGPYPYYGASGVVDRIDDYLFEGLHLLVAEDGENLRSRKKPVAFLANGRFWVNNHAHILLANESNDVRFLAYAVGSTDVAGYVTGSAQPKLTQAALASIPISAPGLVEQRGIAATLAGLDDKIESNDRAIALLEALGAAILSSKVQTDELTGAPVSRDLPLGQLLDVLETGSRPRGGVHDGTVGTVSLGAQHINSAGVLERHDFRSVPTEFAESMRRGKLVDGDVLVYKDGGKPGDFIPHVSAFGFGFPVDAAVINEHVYRVRAVAGISQALLYWALRSRWLDEEMRKRGTGVAIPGLNSSNFRELPFPLLAPEAVEVLNTCLQPMFDKMLQLGAENVRARSLRDALVPELLSGHIRVPEASIAVEEAIA